MDLHAIQIGKRAVRRSIIKTKDEIHSWLKEPVTTSGVHKIKAGLTELVELRKSLQSLTFNELSFIEKEGKNADDINKEAISITKDMDDARATHIKLAAEFENFKGKLEDTSSRESILNSSFVVPELRNGATIKFPDIKIPTFDGEIRKFMDFKNLFENMVHNNTSLSNVQKLYYLKNAVEGKAATVIQDFEINDYSYNQAWTQLLSRYENRRAIIQTHFQDLLAAKTIKSESGLRELIDKSTAAVRGLKICQEDTDGMSTLIAYIVSNKLDEITRRDWEISLTDNAHFPKYDQLIKFLQNRCFAYENRYFEKPKPSVDKKSFAMTIVCSLCSRNHWLNSCNNFIKLNPLKRFEIVKEKRLCLKCFNRSHSAKNCSRAPCKICNGNHHVLLHRKQPTNSPSVLEMSPSSSSLSDTNKTNSPEQRITTSSLSAAFGTNCVILLPTAVVKVFAKNRFVLARILIDSASQPNLISESFVNRYKLPVNKSSYCTLVGGVTDHQIPSNFHVNLKLSSRFENFNLAVSLDIVRKIPYEIPHSAIATIQDLHASYQFAEYKLGHDEIDMVIGAEYFNQIMQGKKEHINNIWLEKSRFGWVISGPCNLFGTSSQYCNLTIYDVQNQLQKFWAVEEVASQNSDNPQDNLCVRHFEKTYTRSDEGQFIVRLPFNEKKLSLENNKFRALAALRRVEKLYDPTTWAKYSDFMKEYDQLGHMSKLAPSLPFSKNCYYIPHRAVLRPNSSTTKLRVVFNASSKSSSDVSLNDALFVGPNIQSELMDILIRFRSHRIAFTCDVEKMYRNILVHEDDRKFQRIVWIDDETNSIRDFQLNTVTYGTAPASFLATKVLEVLANSIESSHPEISDIIKSDFYMDDLLTGANSITEAKGLQKIIHSTLLSAKFPLRKYASNSVEFLESLQPELKSVPDSIPFSDRDTVSILGLQWNPKVDTFSINLNLSILDSTTALTKRTILSEVSKVFDPLGIASPVTIRGKMLLQDIWRVDLGWDDVVPLELSSTFRKYYSELSLLNSFVINRPYDKFLYVNHRQLVGFCDASQKAYCAVVYIRSFDKSGNISSSFVCAKSRVSPLKELTIPRLELLSAVLLAKLLNRVSRELRLTLADSQAFSDSTVVLHWIRTTPPDKLNIFVKNRISEILKFFVPQQWHYINTKSNPADLATRGIDVRSFWNNKLWTDGPEILINCDSIHDVYFPDLESDQVPELKAVKVALISLDNKVDTNFLKKISSYRKLINTIAVCHYFIARTREKCRLSRKCTSKAELTNVTVPFEYFNTSFHTILRLSQLEFFFVEFSRLQTGLKLGKKSSILSLSPYLDERGLLRVGGRLRNSHYSDSLKHPFIIHNKSHFLRLYVSHIHDTYFHATKSFVANFVRNKFWVVGGVNNVAKKICRECTTCIRFKAETVNQRMGQLPYFRSQVSRPFTHSGVDLCGPFATKCVGHRSTKINKSYAAFFVCMVSKAVHVEIVSDLSACTFIAALRRFVARRGLPRDLYSDNATNFVGARNLFQAEFKTISGECKSLEINWHFIPPRAPHRGGLWEAAIKSAKFHLVRATKDRILTFEELNTIFAQIEAILNSRPLAYQQDKDHSYNVITPGHLLVGSPLLVVPDIDSSNMPIAKRWKLIQQIVNSFWFEWKNTYLQYLQNRVIWKYPSTNLKPGDVVIVRDDITKASQWPLGVITETFPDSQGEVRSVKVKTTNGIRHRVVQRLIRLINGSDDST